MNKNSTIPNISHKFFVGTLAALGFSLGPKSDGSALPEKSIAKGMGYCIVRDDRNLFDVLLMGPGGVKGPRYAMGQPHYGSDMYRLPAVRKIVSIDFYHGEPDAAALESATPAESPSKTIRKPVTLIQGDIIVVQYVAHQMYMSSSLNLRVYRTLLQSSFI